MRSGSLLWSFEYAIRGIVHAVRTQRNMRIHLLVAAVVFVGALVLGIGGLELVALVFAVGLVIVSELMNTAIETTVDLATEGFDPLAAIAKDVAAGAVLVSAVTSVAVGYVVFFSRVTPLAQRLFTGVRAAPTSITLVALAITGIVVVVMKAVTHERGATYMRGGWPSGHTALAFAAATAIGYGTNSASAFVLAVGIAMLVAQSRAETGAHTIPQIVAGAAIGFLLATAAFQIFLR